MAPGGGLDWHGIRFTEDVRTCAGRHSTEEIVMNWQTPSYSDIRFGFEVTMYINNK